MITLQFKFLKIWSRGGLWNGFPVMAQIPLQAVTLDSPSVPAQAMVLDNPLTLLSPGFCLVEASVLSNS